MIEVEKVEKYGREVWQNSEMDALRSDNCMCFHCDRVRQGCPAATQYLALCRRYGNAFIMTRCAGWIDGFGDVQHNKAGYLWVRNK